MTRSAATQVDSSGIEDDRNPGPGRLTRPVEGRDVRPRRDHQRGLVVETAPNVVDATAVDLSSSPHDSVVDALELDLAVDEEFDGEERNDEEAAAVVANGNGRPPSRRLRLIGASMDGLPHSRNMHDEVPSTVVANHVPSLPSTIPASSTVLREAHPNPYGRYSVLSDRVDSEPELWVDHTILDSVEGVVDHRRMPDTDSDSTESVQFPDEVLSDVEAFREEIDVEEVEVPLPRWPRRMFMDGLRSLDGVDIRQIFRRRAMVMKSVPKFMQGSFRGVLKAIMEEVNAARLARDVLRQSRAWKAFLLLPRLLLHKPPRGGLIQKKRFGVVCPWQLAFFVESKRTVCGSWFPNSGKEGKTTRDHIGQAGSPGLGIGSDGRVEFWSPGSGGGGIGTRHIGDIGSVDQP